MNMEAASSLEPLSHFEQLRLARDIIRTEGQTLLTVADRLGPEFCEAIEVLFACRGSVIVSGMGKAGLIGQKIAATLASTGTRAHFLHPGEAVHGDLGRVHRDDVVLMLSFSGETEEVTRLLPSLDEIPIIAITGKSESTLARYATVVLSLGTIQEACTLGLAPSTSTTSMLALGDALALVLSRMRHFSALDFVRFHPGGSLGRKLAKVEHLMRPLDQCRLASESETVRQVLVAAACPGRRTGAVMLTDAEGRLTGIFTDSDLARLMGRGQDDYLDRPIRDVMTRTPKCVRVGMRMSEAVGTLAGRKISELPVIDAAGKPVGLIDITDVVALLPPPQDESLTPDSQRRCDTPATLPMGS